MWLNDLPFDGACIIPGPVPLDRANCVPPMIFLAVCKRCILTTTVSRASFPLANNVKGIIPLTLINEQGLPKTRKSFQGFLCGKKAGIKDLYSLKLFSLILKRVLMVFHWGDLPSFQGDATCK